MLEVIGIGLPRTGTMSLKLALEALGFGPCYHMIEVFSRPDHIEFWSDALETEPPWEELFRDFRSTTDTPACFFWRQLTRQYPGAPCIVTTRDSGEWYDSFRSTVCEVVLNPENAPDDLHYRVQKMAKKLILDTMFQGAFYDKATMISLYEQHLSEVRRTISGPLLEFDVTEGWEPLCEFLSVEVPTVPFPFVNSRLEFRERFLKESTTTA